MLEELSTDKKVVGVKQSQRAIEEGKALKAYVASDCDENVKQPFMALCEEKHISVIKADSMEQLGRACGISVGAAVAVILS